MPKTTFAHNCSFILSFFSVFYMAVGSQAIHSYFYQHDYYTNVSPVHHILDPSAEKGYVQHVQIGDERKHEHGPQRIPSHPTDSQTSHNKCPVCEFLTTCWLVASTPEPLSFSATVFEYAVIHYQTFIPSVQPSIWPIRGPPSPTC